MSDRFDPILGPWRGQPDRATAARPDEPEAFAVRLRALAASVALLGARLSLVEQEAEARQLRVVSAWLVGRDSQAPMFLVSDNRLAAGDAPHGLLLAWLADGVDGRSEADEDLVEEVAVFIYDSTVPHA